MDIVNILILISAVTTGIISIINAIKGRDNGVKIDTLHTLINSRLSELLAETKAASHAEGAEQGRQQEAKRQKEEPKN